MFKFSKSYLIIFIIPVILSGFFCYNYFSTEPVVVGQTQKPEQPQEISITISALGDCALGNEYTQRGHTFASVFAEKGSAYFFANVEEVLATDDLTIANLETCLTTVEQRRDKSQEKTPFWIKGEPGYTRILTEGSVEIVNIANNHTYDYGEAGFQETLQSLEKAEIAYCGYEHSVIKEIKGLKIGFVGFNQFGHKGLWQSYLLLKEQMVEQVEALVAQVDLVIVSFHWGQERALEPSAKQYELAKLAVLAGADLVLGHHPHVLQGLGEYQGKTIVFSLGNFCFGGNRQPYERDTIIYQHIFTFVEGKLERSENKIIPCSMTTTPGLNDFQPAILSGLAAEKVRQKLSKRTQMLKEIDF